MFDGVDIPRRGNCVAHRVPGDGRESERAEGVRLKDGAFEPRQDRRAASSRPRRTARATPATVVEITRTLSRCIRTPLAENPEGDRMAS